MRGVALNFFPLEQSNFVFRLHRAPYVENSRPELGPETAQRRSLPSGGEHVHFWTMFQPFDGSEPFDCQLFDNTYATLDVLRRALLDMCSEKLDLDDYEVVGGFRKRAEITLHRFPEGNQVITLEPYLLRARSVFGFLADFRFRPSPDHEGTRRAMELSLSIDGSGQSNLNYYADRYEKLQEFVRRIHPKIFPLTVGDASVAVRKKLVELDSELLAVKTFVVGSGRESRSQFMGVKSSGPYEAAPEGTQFFFVYRPEDRPLSQDLFKALRGDLFRTFDGMGRMFGVEWDKENVHGVALREFTADEIRRVRDQIRAAADGSPVLPIVLTPFARGDEPDENAAYWQLKHAFLASGIPIQVVAAQTIRDRDKLKWSTSGIGLQIFAKSGGTPWKVKPRNERCLIVGVGQAHRIVERRIERFFAYSVLTDSSGVFEEVRVLGESQNQKDYLEGFGASLRQIFTDYRDRFNSFVVHATFSIRREELEQVADVLSESEKSQAEPGEFVSIKFNDRNKFFGFAADHNSRVPYESTVVQLAGNEYLLWFEGLQFNKPTLAKMVGGPVHASFGYPGRRLSPDHQKAHLQDAINLSGSNWRGFNAKSLPVSVYYAQIIARYTKEFEAHGLPEIDVATLTPWFL